MSKKLLLADDSVTIQRVIELTFSGEDVQVLTAGDGEEAIARITAEKPDIVLADIGMPKRSGYDVSAFVKGNADLSHIPVLLLAGAFEPVDDAKAKEARCDGVLVKPFEPQQVIARVRELIGGAKGSPTQPAVSDIPRPAAVLTAPRPVELPKREDFSIPEDLMAFGDDDLLPRADALLSHGEHVEAAGPPLVLDDSLDDYFDKLDEAFATITSSPGLDPVAPQGDGIPREGSVLERDLDSLDEATINALSTPHVGVPRSGAVDPFAGLDGIEHEGVSVPTLDDLLAGMPAGPKTTEISFDRTTEPHQAARAPVMDMPPIGIVPPPRDPPDATPTLTAAPSAVEMPSTGRSIIADAFSALLAAEQGEPGAMPIRLGSNGSTPVVTDRMIDDVARRVIQKLALGSSDQMHAMVREIVSGVAERLVREEIDRIRRQGAGGSGH
jgi:CheY-like chemotaxis protein